MYKNINSEAIFISFSLSLTSSSNHFTNSPVVMDSYTFRPGNETFTSAESTFNPNYIGTKPPLFALIGFVLVFSFGFFGNGLIIKVYLKSKALRHPPNLFILILLYCNVYTWINMGG